MVVGLFVLGNGKFVDLVSSFRYFDSFFRDNALESMRCCVRRKIFGGNAENMSSEDVSLDVKRKFR